MANSQLAQRIADNQQLAAQTQQALRSNRRVIRHPVAGNDTTTTNPKTKAEFVPEPESESESESAPQSIDTPTATETGGTSKGKALNLAATFPPFEDTFEEAIPIQPLALSQSPRPPALVKPKRSSNVVTLPNANSNITVSPLDLPTEHFQAGLDRRRQNRHLLTQWLSTALVNDIDFGRIHVVGKDRCQLVRIGKMADCMDPSHWSKPVLFKAGAEKITSALGVTVHYPSLRDYEAAVLSTAEIHMIVLRCELRDAHGNVVAEGIGARDLKQDWGDVNKALKMCAKSAHIDAVLRLAGISSMFTQDIDDRPPIPDTGDSRFDDGVTFPSTALNQVQVQAQGRSVASRSSATASKTKRQVTSPPPAPSKNDTVGGKPISKPESVSVQTTAATSASATYKSDDSNELVSRAELVILRQAIANNGFTERRVVSWLIKSTQGEVTTLEQLRKARYASLLKRLDQWAETEHVQQQQSSSSSTDTPQGARS